MLLVTFSHDQIAYIKSANDFLLVTPIRSALKNVNKVWDHLLRPPSSEAPFKIPFKSLFSVIRPLYYTIYKNLSLLVLMDFRAFVHVCGRAIPRCNRLGTNMNLGKEDHASHALHARGAQKCVF